MEDLATLIILNITVPGLLAGLVAAIAKRRGISGTLGNLALGAVGGLGGGLLALQAFQKYHVTATPDRAWMIWLAASFGGLLLVTIARGIVNSLAAGTEDAQDYA